MSEPELLYKLFIFIFIIILLSIKIKNFKKLSFKQTIFNILPQQYVERTTNELLEQPSAISGSDVVGSCYTLLNTQQTAQDRKQLGKPFPLLCYETLLVSDEKYK